MIFLILLLTLMVAWYFSLFLIWVLTFKTENVSPCVVSKLAVLKIFKVVPRKTFSYLYWQQKLWADNQEADGFLFLEVALKPWRQGFLCQRQLDRPRLFPLSCLHNVCQHGSSFSNYFVHLLAILILVPRVLTGHNRNRTIWCFFRSEGGSS